LYSDADDEPGNILVKHPLQHEELMSQPGALLTVVPHTDLAASLNCIFFFFAAAIPAQEACTRTADEAFLGIQYLSSVKERCMRRHQERQGVIIIVAVDLYKYLIVYRIVGENTLLAGSDIVVKAPLTNGR
jgi:hypothetical protein